MGTHTEFRSITGEEEQQPTRAANEAQSQTLRRAATELAAALSWLPGTSSADAFAKRCSTLVTFFKAMSSEVEAAYSKMPGSEDLLWLRTNAQQLSSSARQVASDLEPLQNLPVVSDKNEIMPRVLAIAQACMGEADTALTKTQFTEFCLVFEETTPLEYHEIGALVPALKLVLLEKIAGLAGELLKNPESESRVVPYIRIFQHVTQASWKDELESLIPFDGILRDDPVDAYCAMNLESRNVYRETVARLARRSDLSELEVAQQALNLARQARKRSYADPRIAMRESHIGYYLVGEGATILSQRVGFHPTFGDRFRSFLRAHPDEFLLGGIAVLTLAIITVAVWLLTPVTTPVVLVLLSMLILLLPGSQAAVQLMNYVTTNLLPATSLPKLDFSKGIPDDCVTMVAIPTLLLSDEQVHTLIEELEVRYLGNHDRNIHFAIVSDLPDAYQPARKTTRWLRCVQGSLRN